MSGETVINISVGIIRNTSLPAITLCHYGLDFRKLSLLNENVSKLYKQYLAVIENANGNKIQDENFDLSNLYIKALEIYFPSNEQIIQTKDILNNLIPWNKNNGTFLYSYFHSASAYGDIDKDLFKYNSYFLAMKSLPMESLIINTVLYFPDILLCHTLFSHSESSWDNITMIFHKFYLLLLVEIQSIPIFPSNRLIMIMHSPNTLSIEGSPYINPGYEYLIEYSKWNIIRLGKGYDTDCREYDPKKYNRNDCIFDCYQERAKYICRTNNFVSFFPLLKKKNYFEQSNLNFSRCNIEIKYRNEISELCYDKCHKECHVDYYSITINKISEFDTFQAALTFKHNSMPDLTIRHIPEMPFLTFICNFGGILGMWVGVAFVDILNRVWNLLRVKILSIISTIIFINTNQNIFPIISNSRSRGNQIRIIR